MLNTIKNEQLAKAITEALMKNGKGEKAVRLQLRGENERNLGGMGRSLVFAIVLDEIERNVAYLLRP